MKNKNTIWSNNIAFLRKRYLFTQEELASKTGINRSRIAAHESGNIKNPSVDDILALSNVFKVHIDTLLKIELHSLSEEQFQELESNNDAYISGNSLRILTIAVDGINNNVIEFVPEKAKAGYLVGYSDQEYISKLDLFSIPGLSKNKKHRIFEILGDSMLPVPERSLIIGEYIEDWYNVKNGTPCIVVTKENGIVFKIVENKIREHGYITLNSLNAIYEPFNVDITDVVEIWKYKKHISDSMPEGEMTIQQLAKSIYALQHDLNDLKRFIKKA